MDYYRLGHCVTELKRSTQTPWTEGLQREELRHTFKDMDDIGYLHIILVLNIQQSSPWLKEAQKETESHSGGSTY